MRCGGTTAVLAPACQAKHLLAFASSGPHPTANSGPFLAWTGILRVDSTYTWTESTVGLRSAFTWLQSSQLMVHACVPAPVGLLAWLHVLEASGGWRGENDVLIEGLGHQQSLACAP